MRTHLITKLVCIKCGSLLKLSYADVVSRHSAGEPSGAFMYDNTIGVEPCAKCYEPAQRILDAVSVLQRGKK